MRLSIKTVFFFILPVIAVLFYQAERTRLTKTQSKTSQYFDQSEVSSVYDDDTISLPDVDEDGDDSSESTFRALPGIASMVSVEICHHYSTGVLLPLSFKISYKEISPSFLKVFRI
jgi:hypothetical protein